MGGRFLPQHDPFGFGFRVGFTTENPRGITKRMTHPRPGACVERVYSERASITGAVMSILCFFALPPKIYPASKRKPA